MSRPLLTAELEKLLLAYLECRERGDPRSPEELCLHSPALLEPLKAQIAALEAASPAFAGSGDFAGSDALGGSASFAAGAFGGVSCPSNKEEKRRGRIKNTIPNSFLATSSSLELPNHGNTGYRLIGYKTRHTV